MKLNNFLVLSSLALAATVCQSAHAEIYEIQYTGIINDGVNTSEGVDDSSGISGMDYLGLFGSPGQNLAGEQMSITYTINTNLGHIDGSSANGFVTIIGGSIISPPSISPVTSVLINVGGNSLLLDSNSYESYGYDSRLLGVGFTNTYGFQTRDYFFDKPPSDLDRIWYYPASHLFLNSQILPNSTTLAAAILYNAALLDDGYNQLYIGGQSTGELEYLSANVANVSVTPLSAAVPEPSAWAMMLVGLGVIGTVARRRQNVRVAYA